MKLWPIFEERRDTAAPAGSIGRSADWGVPVLCALLSALVFLVFSPALSSGFINYDDETYVTANPHIQGGLTATGLAWAFGRLHGEQTYWHPLTWVSHMLDCQLYGLRPGGHHLTNVLLHAVNALLVFLLFRRMTGAFWRSGVLAALFAVHPLQVDTVAWVAERKNLLSAMFWMLTIWAYVAYVEKSQVSSLKSKATPGAEVEAPRSRRHVSRFTYHVSRYYFLSLLLFALGLMCKPVLVTLPFVLLLLDYWPLRRTAERGMRNAASGTPLEASHPTLHVSRFTFHPPPRLLIEKLPFLCLSLVSSAVTLVAHRSLGLLEASSAVAVDRRIENALVSYGRYLGKTLWPSKLAIFYPYPDAWPRWEVVLSGLLLAVITVTAISICRRRPWPLVGWLWFVGVLVPFIGLVQAGAQAMADRFMYVPLIGLLIALVWGICDLTTHLRGRGFTLSAAALVAIGLCAVLAHRQAGYWKDSELLFRHAVSVTENNALAHNNLGAALLSKGRIDEAVAQFQLALQTKPDNIDLLNNLACALEKNGLTNQAFLQLERALTLNPNRADTHNNLGSLLLQTGRVEDGIAQYQEALRLKPDLAQAEGNLGSALFREQRSDEAIVHLRQAAALAPYDASAHRHLAAALASTGQLDDALLEFQQVLKLAPADAPAHCSVGILLGRRGRLDEAAAHLEEAVRLQPGNAEAQCNLGITRGKQGRPDAAIAHLSEAIRLQPKNAEAHCNLGVLLGMKGRLDEAISHLQEAIKLKPGYVDAQNNLRTALEVKAASPGQPQSPSAP
jgi:protein O-mannosyl-transferase